MKSNVRISKLTFAIALVFCFGALGLFVSYWFARQAEIKVLVEREAALRADIEQLVAGVEQPQQFIRYELEQQHPDAHDADGDSQ